MATENSPLLPTTAPKPPRNVTFHPQQTVVSPGGTTSTSLGVTGLPTHHTSSTSPSSQLSASGLAALNSKLRRRNSSGAPAIPNTPLPRIGPQRTTKNAEKLQFLPNVEHVDGDEESGRDVYSQFTKIKDPTARRDAARLGKADRDRLPRVCVFSDGGGGRAGWTSEFVLQFGALGIGLQMNCTMSSVILCCAFSSLNI